MLVALLLLGSGVAWIAGSLQRGSAPRPPGQLLIGEPSAQVTPADVPVVLVDRDGLRRTLLVEVESLDEFDARLAGAMEQLREALLEESNWPEGVDAPYVQSYEAQRRRVVVIDVPALGPGSGLELLAELAALRSLEETALAHGADEVRVVVEGEPSSTLWGQVALR